ncbi:MAG: polysaccharide deacetylase family protein, partial [Anaerotignum sp.]|nr:polysaccharide deacetylase family protein [Anaerotignum sp.]
MKKKRSLAFLLLFTILTGLCGCSASAITVREKRSSEALAKAETFWEEQTKHQLGEPVIFTDYVKPLAYALQYPKTGYPAIDARIEGIVTELRTAFEQEYLPQENTPGEKRRSNHPIATLYLGYETYLADEDHLSLLFFETTETAADGMSPHIRIHAYHFDLSEDKELSAEELMWQDFRKNASVYTQRYFTATEPYSQWMFGDYATRLAPENGYFDRFVFTEDGVLFHFEKYTLFPGHMGIVTLNIPYADMRTKMTPEAEKTIAPPASITNKKMVALTYDDGPNPIHTNAILDVLEKYDARATFFDLGYLVEKYPDVVKREAALGCEVGSHSWDHDNFNKLSETAIKEDVTRTDAVFQKVLGRSPSSFRPP